MQQERYTIAEARAALGGLSRTTIYRLCAAGELVKTAPTTTPPKRRVYITGESLHAYKDRQAAEHQVRAAS